MKQESESCCVMRVETRLTELGDGAIEGDISELLVEIVLSGGRLVSADNSVGFDVSLVLLEDLKQHS